MSGAEAQSGRRMRGAGEGPAGATRHARLCGAIAFAALLPSLMLGASLTGVELPTVSRALATTGGAGIPASPGGAGIPASAGGAGILASPGGGAGIPASPGEAAQAQRIVAIGDIHGDFDNFALMLRETGLVDGDLAWAGGDAILVQTGDFTDRGPQVREVMDLLMRLQEEAPGQGGRVHVTLGNHDAMNLLDFLRDTTAADYAAFAGEESPRLLEDAWTEHMRVARRRADARGEPEPDFDAAARRAWLADHPPGFLERMRALGPDGRYGKWLRTLPAVVRVDDVLFLHGGISAELAARSLAEINGDLQAEVETYDEAKEEMADRGLIAWFATFTEVIEAADAEVLAVGEKRAAGEQIGRRELSAAQRYVRLLEAADWSLLSADGPLWFRGYAPPPTGWSDEDGAAPLQAVLDAYGARHLVVGHSTQRGSILRRWDGAVFLTDTGMLEGYVEGGRPSALEIAGGVFTAVYPDGRETLLDTRAPDVAAALPGLGPRTVRWAGAAERPSYDGQAGAVPNFGLAVVAGRPLLERQAPEAGLSLLPPPPRRSWIGPDGMALPFADDDEMLEFLRNAEIVDLEPVGEGKTGARRAVLERDGVRMRAIFHDVDLEEPRVRIRGRFHMVFRDSWRSQVAAYRVARLLGIVNVPPTVQRRIGGYSGSLQAWLEGAMTDTQRRERELRPPVWRLWLEQERVMRVFDNLIYNDDRNTGNVLMGADGNLWMIDHTRAFQRHDELRDPNLMTRVERTMWRRLQELPDETLAGVVEDLLLRPDVNAFLERRRSLVAHIQALIEERGEEAVVFEWQDAGLGRRGLAIGVAQADGGLDLEVDVGLAERLRVGAEKAQVDPHDPHVIALGGIQRAAGGVELGAVLVEVEEQRLGALDVLGHHLIGVLVAPGAAVPAVHGAQQVGPLDPVGDPLCSAADGGLVGRSAGWRRGAVVDIGDERDPGRPRPVEPFRRAAEVIAGHTQLVGDLVQRHSSLLPQIGEVLLGFLGHLALKQHRDQAAEEHHGDNHRDEQLDERVAAFG